MQMNRNRLAAVSSATLALVIASTASVAAFGPRDDDRGFGPGDGRVGRGMGHADGMRDRMWAGIAGGLDGFERREVTLQTADGTSSRRVENGVVETATDGSLEFTLGSGEVVSVTFADEIAVVAFSEQTIERRGWSRQRMLPAEVEVADIEAGARVVVWSESEDGGDFVAQRIVIQPTADEEDGATSAEEAPVEGSTSEAPASEEDTSAAAVTDA